MNICLNDKIFITLGDILAAENVKGYVIGGWVKGFHTWQGSILARI